MCLHVYVSIRLGSRTKHEGRVALLCVCAYGPEVSIISRWKSLLGNLLICVLQMCIFVCWCNLAIFDDYVESAYHGYIEVVIGACYVVMAVMAMKTKMGMGPDREDWR